MALPSKLRLSLILALFAVIGVGVLDALKCATDGKTMSRCALSDGANGTFDLAAIFASGPLNVTSTMNPTKTPYSYLFNPVKGVNCTGTTGPCSKKNCSMCQIDYQYTTFTFGAGDLTTAVYNVSASDPKSNMWIVNVTYTGGNANRQVDVEFRYDAKATKPVYAFISESPMLHYHLNVTSSLVMPKMLTITSDTSSPKDDTGKSKLR
jgi:hypothetical protein